MPYWPALKLAVGSVTAALAMSYLELRYPSPPPEPGRRYGLPVEVSFARMADELAMDSRTLGLALLCVSTWWESEIRRISAVRSGREFVNHSHRRWPRLKLYSIVAERKWKSLETVALRRNWPMLTKTLENACITNLCAPPSPSQLSPMPRCQDLEKFATQPTTFSTLPELLLRGVELAQDRRKTRYARRRMAMKNGLVAPDPAKICHQQETEAVEPELAVIAARLAARSR